MPTFFPTDPNDRIRTQAEMMDWQKANEERERQKRIERRKFVATITLSGVAALAAVAGVIVQLVLAQ